MVNVYAWPPVATVSKEWTVFDPVGSSYDFFTGAEYVSASQRRRKIATIEASSRFSPHGAGAGYMEALKRYLKGGIHLVRLTHRTRTFTDMLLPNSLRSGEFVGWIQPSDPVEWVDDDEDRIRWFNGVYNAYTVVSGASVPTVQVTGLTPGALFALPGEFVQIIPTSGLTQTVMVMAPVIVNASGVANVRLEVQPSSAGRINFGAIETGVFKADSMPRAVEPSGRDWSYTWNFTEVFEDERGTFVEKNPWNSNAG